MNRIGEEEREAMLGAIREDRCPDCGHRGGSDDPRCHRIERE